MSKNLFSLLAVKSGELKTGVVQGKTKNGVLVKIGSFTQVIPSAISDSLPIGSRVVIGEADGSKYIIGQEKLNNQLLLEVYVNG